MMLIGSQYPDLLALIRAEQAQPKRSETKDQVSPKDANRHDGGDAGLLAVKAH